MAVIEGNGDLPEHSFAGAVGAELNRHDAGLCPNHEPDRHDRFDRKAQRTKQEHQRRISLETGTQDGHRAADSAGLSACQP